MRQFVRKLIGHKTQESTTRLIVGLGNIGQEYAKTRHNAGFIAVDWLSTQFGTSQWKNVTKLNAYIAKNVSHDLIFAKPTTMMNLSGQSVAQIMHYYKISLENIYIIHDDADLDLGVIKLSQETKSGAGHHGVLSIIQSIGNGFKRIRIGIGRPDQPKREISDFVLGRLSNEDINILRNSFGLLINLMQKK